MPRPHMTLFGMESFNFLSFFLSFFLYFCLSVCLFYFQTWKTNINCFKLEFLSFFVSCFYLLSFFPSFTLFFLSFFLCLFLLSIFSFLLAGQKRPHVISCTSHAQIQFPTPLSLSSSCVPSCLFVLLCQKKQQPLCKIISFVRPFCHILSHFCPTLIPHLLPLSLSLSLSSTLTHTNTHTHMQHPSLFIPFFPPTVIPGPISYVCLFICFQRGSK